MENGSKGKDPVPTFVSSRASTSVNPALNTVKLWTQYYNVTCYNTSASTADLEYKVVRTMRLYEQKKNCQTRLLLLLLEQQFYVSTYTQIWQFRDVLSSHSLSIVVMKLNLQAPINQKILQHTKLKPGLVTLYDLVDWAYCYRPKAHPGLIDFLEQLRNLYYKF